jgi:hypothetical protein
MMMASAPAVMMTSATVMAPAWMAAAVTVAAAPDLNDRIIGVDKCIRVCDGHCRRRQDWSQRKNTGGESRQQKTFHMSSSKPRYS